MKRLLRKILLFLLVYIGVAQIIDILAPYYYGNPWYAAKMQFLEDESSTGLHNTYFFGSSRVYHNINPLVFEELCNRNGHQIRSFNLGAPITFSPQSYYLYQNFLNSKQSEGTQLVFIELTGLETFEERLHTEMSSYYITFANFMFAIRSINANFHLPISIKLQLSYRYFISLVEKLFQIGHFGQHLLETDLWETRYVGPNLDGHLSLDDDLNQKHNDFLAKRQNELKIDSTPLPERAQSIQSMFDSPTNYVDQIHLKKINDLIEDSKQKNVHLIFVLMPRVGTKNIIDLFNAIPDDHKIQLSKPSDYPELYTVENSFDIGHMNKKGSLVHSKIFAQQYLDLVKRVRGSDLE
jgi:hypothetical protein